MNRAAALGMTALLLAACTHTTSKPVAARFVANGVEVTIAVCPAAVRATYRPLRPGFHLYSVDLPPNGIEGLGIPTRLEVRNGMAATGPLSADKPVRLLRLQALNVQLPVYPDGPVTVTLPVRRTSGAAEIAITYGACSASTCLAPVIGKVVPVPLGGTAFGALA